MKGTQIVQLIPAPWEYHEALEALREHAIAALRIVGVREGLVLDPESVVFEGALEPNGPGQFMLRYTAYAYPAGQVPAVDECTGLGCSCYEPEES